MKNKRCLELVTSRSSGHKTSSEKFLKKEKKGKKLQKSDYLENDKSFLDEIKKNFHSF